MIKYTNDENNEYINIPYMKGESPFPLPNIKRYKALLPKDFDKNWKLEKIVFYDGYVTSGSLYNGFAYHIKKRKL
jgi:hypothetical protein